MDTQQFTKWLKRVMSMSVVGNNDSTLLGSCVWSDSNGRIVVTMPDNVRIVINVSVEHPFLLNYKGDSNE